MKNSMKVFIAAITATIILSIVGVIMFVEVAGEDGETIASGTAPGTLSFEASTLQYYEIYAEDSDVSIELGDFNHDPEFTFLDMCNTNSETSGITGNCGTIKGSKTMVGSLTIGAGDGGTAILELEGTGEVIIVETSLASIFGILVALCSGCCLAPLIALISGLKAFKNNPSTQVIVIEQTPQSKTYDGVNQAFDKHYQTDPQLGHNNIGNQFNTNSQATQLWDQGVDLNSNYPQPGLNGSSDPAGTEWLDHDGKKYYRTTGPNTDWIIYNQ
jgi:hypothetical protein